MTIRFDSRQQRQRAVLDELSNDVDLRLDVILNLINDELTPPLRLRKDSSASNRRLYIDAIEVQTLDSTSGTVGNGRKRTIQPISNLIPSFTGGYVEFPEASGGSVTASGVVLESTYAVTLASGNFRKVMVSLNSQGQIVLSFGTEAATEEAATLPNVTANTFAIGYVTIRNLSETIQDIDDANVRQFVGGLPSVPDASASVSGLVNTSAQTFGGSKTFSGDVTVSGSLVPSSSMMFRNKIMNGSFDVWQRATSWTAAGDATRLADGWRTRFAYTGGTTDIALDTGPTLALPNALRMTHKTANCTAITHYSLRHLIEKQFARHLVSDVSNITLSFWYKSNRTGTHAVNFDAGASGAFFTGTTTAGSGTFTVNAANTWEYKTVTFPIAVTGNGSNAENLAGFILNFTWASGLLPIAVNDYFAVAGVQLERGSAATPFEHRHIQTELSMCQRYYQVIAQPGVDYVYPLTEWGLNTSNSQVAAFVPLKVTMRSSPTYSETQTSAGTTRARLVGSGLSSAYAPNINGIYNVTSASFYAGGTTTDGCVLVLTMSPAQTFTNIPTWDTYGCNYRLAADSEIP